MRGDGTAWSRGADATAGAHQAGQRGGGRASAGATGRPSRTRADQKCPHGHAYHAIVNVLPLNGGTWAAHTTGTASQGPAGALRQSCPQREQQPCRPGSGRKDTPRRPRDEAGRNSPDDGGENSRRLRRLREPEFLDPVANLIAVEAEQGRPPGLVAAPPLERLNDEAALELLEIDALGRERQPAATGAAPVSAGKSAGSSHGAVASSMARSTALRSSRMLPGQP